VIELALSAWVLLGLGALVVGFSKTALPGAGTLAVVLFATALPARESTAALLVILLVGDLFAVWTYRRTVDWGILRRLIVPVVVGVAVGAVFLAVASDDVVRRVIGAILLVLLVITLLRRRSERSAGATTDARRSGGLIGAGYGWLGGFTTMVANAGGPVMSLYLVTMRLPVTTFLGTAAYFFFAVNLSKLPFHIGIGLLNGEIFLLSVSLIPLVVVAGLAGRWVAGRISQQFFERAVLVLTAIGAVQLLV
jgi:uncharacterized protein